ncbi:1-aminocyclopropane-1-carboxylate deaminase/D-cysteine desulfhydrase [Pseudohalioglobus lutimaris]|nr:pyridoxal-phosphate dependent enzyme [Pseudohalioglobus lutimaris]
MLQLCADPVLGVSMRNVTVLRLDLLGGSAPGNKVFKLRGSLRAAQARGIKRILSFGGAWSNHLHALAAVGAELDLETVGVVRGAETETPALEDMRRWGMQIVPVSRETYRRRFDSDWLADLEQRHAPCLVVPEGGAGADGLRGCLEIADMVNRSGRIFSRVLVPVGTGTTLAGLIAGLRGSPEVFGVAALKGARDLEERVQEYLHASGLPARVSWQIIHDAHCGGFARTSAELRAFMLAFESVQRLPLEPVYTGKMLYALHSRLAQGRWAEDEPVLVVHTGGLQGRRGYAWLG